MSSLEGLYSVFWTLGRGNRSKAEQNLTMLWSYVLEMGTLKNTLLEFSPEFNLDLQSLMGEN